MKKPGSNADDLNDNGGLSSSSGYQMSPLFEKISKSSNSSTVQLKNSGKANNSLAQLDNIEMDTKKFSMTNSVQTVKLPSNKHPQVMSYLGKY